ncbi:MAG: F0F1 ATP synthase subunit epsilon [Epsilonproteobacteria bacterium]|nr:F0F1 ATP synthase subunit epsilon [Campylobacterota bacterium]
MSTMRLEIVTPMGEIYNAEVSMVTLPGSEGEFGVLPGHAALVSLLDAGVITIKTANGNEVLVAIDSGYVKVDEEKVIAIVDGAVVVKDEEGVLSENIEEAKKLLQSAATSDTAIAAAVSKVESIKR